MLPVFMQLSKLLQAWVSPPNQTRGVSHKTLRVSFQNSSTRLTSSLCLMQGHNQATLIHIPNPNPTMLPMQRECDFSSVMIRKWTQALSRNKNYVLNYQFHPAKSQCVELHESDTVSLTADGRIESSPKVLKKKRKKPESVPTGTTIWKIKNKKPCYDRSSFLFRETVDFNGAFICRSCYWVNPAKRSFSLNGWGVKRNLCINPSCEKERLGWWPCPLCGAENTVDAFDTKRYHPENTEIPPPHKCVKCSRRTRTISLYYKENILDPTAVSYCNATARAWVVARDKEDNSYLRHQRDQMNRTDVRNLQFGSSKTKEIKKVSLIQDAIPLLYGWQQRRLLESVGMWALLPKLPQENHIPASMFWPKLAYLFYTHPHILFIMQLLLPYHPLCCLYYFDSPDPTQAQVLDQFVHLFPKKTFA